jgi:predicted Zn-dependent peptidase
MYIGDSPADKAKAVFERAFSNIEREPAQLSTKVVRTSAQAKHLSEEMELSQSKLVMGFRAGTAIPDKEVNATRLMCAILGGTANSKLFCNVREKQSLCYYCSARYDRLKGFIIVDSGVEGENIEKAEAGILKEIEDMKNGIISDFEMDATKMAVINSFRSSNDTVGGIESWYSSQLFDDNFQTIEELSNAINAVTKEEVVAAANKLNLDTVYVLKNK